MLYVQRIILILIPFLLTSCAMSMSKNEIDEIKTVGIINKFPEYPNYAIIGTTIFNNDYDVIKDKQFYQNVTSVTKNYLSKKGYIVSSLPDGDDTARTKVDLVIELRPRDVYMAPGTYGYGVNQCSFLGSVQTPRAYVALNIGPYLHGNSKGMAIYKQTLKKLPFETMPLQWQDLSEKDKEITAQLINSITKQAITELLDEVFFKEKDTTSTIN